MAEILFGALAMSCHSSSRFDGASITIAASYPALVPTFGIAHGYQVSVIVVDGTGGCPLSLVSRVLTILSVCGSLYHGIRGSEVRVG
jgi:hypothetical protein